MKDEVTPTRQTTEIGCMLPLAATYPISTAVSCFRILPNTALFMHAFDINTNTGRRSGACEKTLPASSLFPTMRLVRINESCLEPGHPAMMLVSCFCASHIICTLMQTGSHCKLCFNDNSIVWKYDVPEWHFDDSVPHSWHGSAHGWLAHSWPIKQLLLWCPYCPAP